MSIVLRWLSRLALVLLALLVALAAVWGYARLTTPTAAQREALALMERPAAPEGDNGWTILMALPDAPAASLPPSAECGEEGGCIAQIEAALEANGQTLEAWRPRLDAAARGLRAPMFRGPADLGPSDPFPPFQPVMQLDGLRALDFARGNRAGALDAACRDAEGAIVRATRPDTLLEAMIGIAVFRQHALLIAEMRQRDPALPLPESCDALAVAPNPAAEGTICAALRGEWHYQKGWLPTLQDQLAAHQATNPEADGTWWPAAATRLLHDADWFLARSAQHFATACGAEAEAAARADRVHRLAATPPRWVDRVGFAGSVVVDWMSNAAYGDYSERQLDYLAQRRLLAALLQMDAIPGPMTNAERFAALPDGLRDGPRALLIEADGSALSVPLRSRRYEPQGNVLRLPLPDRAASEPASTRPEPPPPAAR